MTATTTAQIIAFPENLVGLSDAYLRGLRSDATRRAYRRAIDGFGAFLGAKALLAATRRDIEAYRAALEAQGLAPATVCLALSGLAGFYGFAIDEDLIARNPATVARRPRVSVQSPRRALTAQEVKAIIAACDAGTLVGLRDRAMLMLLAVQGWRIAEVLALAADDLAEEAGHKVATVHGKGGKVVRVPLAAATWQALNTWRSAAGMDYGPVFVQVGRKSVPVLGAAVSQQAAWKRLRLLARRAGVERTVHAHLFRHSAVTEALQAGMALHLVQDFARHADPKTTRRYDTHRQALSNATCHVLASRLDADMAMETGTGQPPSQC